MNVGRQERAGGGGSVSVGWYIGMNYWFGFPKPHVPEVKETQNHMFLKLVASG